jgi:hypothetical protein
VAQDGAEWHVVKRREPLQRIARTGELRRAAVPQLNWSVGGNDVAKGCRLTFGLRRCRRKLRNRRYQLFVDGIHLFDVDVGDFLVLL